MKNTFTVVCREVLSSGRQVSADVVRNDGKVVRTGLWPDCAAIEADLLNEYAAKGWTSAQYFIERKLRLGNE